MNSEPPLSSSHKSFGIKTLTDSLKSRQELYPGALFPGVLYPGAILLDLLATGLVEQLEARFLANVGLHELAAPKKLPPEKYIEVLTARLQDVIIGKAGRADDELLELAAFALLGVRLGLTRVSASSRAHPYSQPTIGTE